MKHIILMFFIVSLISGNAYACSCFLNREPLAEEVAVQVERASVVFVGDPTNIELSSIETCASTSSYQLVEFAVVESWKGLEQSQIFTTQTSTGCCNCSYLLDKQVRQLIFAYRTSAGYYSISTCSLSGPVSESIEVIEILRQQQR